MKNSTKHSLAVLAGVLALAGAANAKDITINDGQNAGFGAGAPGAWAPFGGAGATGHDSTLKEDNEVEDVATVGQEWDLEALIFNTNHKLVGGAWASTAGTQLSLGILGGYNMLAATGGFAPGDIFIDLNGDANPMPVGSGYSTILNPGFDYVVHFNSFGNSSTTALRTAGIGTGAYTVYKLSATSLLKSVNFGTFFESNPWRYVSGGASVSTGTASYTTGLNNAQAKAISDGAGTDGTALASQRTIKGDSAGNTKSHNYLEVPLDWMVGLGVSELGGHVTMGCGNDELLGFVKYDFTIVPDGGTSMMMLGAGLTALSMFSRRMNRK